MSTECFDSYDFVAAQSIDRVAQKMRLWTEKASERFEGGWEAIAPCDGKILCNGSYLRSFEDCLEEYGVFDGVAAGAELELGSDAVPALMLLSVGDVVAMVDTILGSDSGLQDQDDVQALTSIQLSMCSIVLDCVVSAMSEAWPGESSLKMTTGSIVDASHFARKFHADELIVVARIQLALPDLNAVFHFASSKELMEGLFVQAGILQPRQAGRVSRKLVGGMELELVCELGNTQMTMGQVKNLNAGDLLLLSQRIDEPLTVKSDCHRLLTGWPGKLGNQLGLEVHQFGPGETR